MQRVMWAETTMAAVFPPWANTATHLVLGGIAVGLVGAVAAPMVIARAPY